tara:strand:- start:17 stop:121 length:105 start_codon:yes stop_codon:yes gene_type:complete
VVKLQQDALTQVVVAKDIMVEVEVVLVDHHQVMM